VRKCCGVAVKGKNGKRRDQNHLYLAADQKLISEGSFTETYKEIQSGKIVANGLIAARQRDSLRVCSPCAMLYACLPVGGRSALFAKS
jgi:hypothetical protein